MTIPRTTGHPTTDPGRTVGRRRLSGRAGLALAGAGLLAATGLGALGQATPAQAAPSAPLSTVDLLQSTDVGALRANLGELNQQQTDLYGARTVSACTGEAGLDSVTGDKTLVSLGSTWSNADGENRALVTEAVAQARTPAAAARAANAVVTALRACQHEPKGHWRYGRVYHGPLRDGDHVWLDAIDGNGTVSGGVAVMLRGDRFGVVEVSNAVGDGDDAIKNTVLPAEQRLGG
ncbi:hypothetical protein FHX74_000969 [Friedmanniella endophytica]|uniref:PknH-like extracellular domain-containing protein n=1 Tax=Microlunatus kandeliicorticis TaxID=1759536 RepID=A0A7W3P4X8_9ACTN|nr:hypothetical protein [Microlunatus kandeliicorticis]MBA8793364.1 hypothetical protein [Microlunatus kandeliicorticis]